MARIGEERFRREHACELHLLFLDPIHFGQGSRQLVHCGGCWGIVALVCPFEEASKGSRFDVRQCRSHLLLLFHVGVHQPVEGFGVLGNQGFVGIEGLLPHQEAEDLAAVDAGGERTISVWVLRRPEGQEPTYSSLSAILLLL